MKSAADIFRIPPVFLAYTAVHLYRDNSDSVAFQRFSKAMLHRQPGNLRLHVQRIFCLAADMECQAAAMQGALLDLFIVLGEKGIALRRRMLSVAHPFINNEAIDFFTDHLMCGLDARTPVSFKAHSVLTGGFDGTATMLIRQSSTERNAELSLYEEAALLLEYGDVEQAQLLLEEALRQQPDEQTAEDLLAIYQYQNDNDALAGMRQWFMDNDVPLPDCWPLQ